jgi:ribonuclease HII
VNGKIILNKIIMNDYRKRNTCRICNSGNLKKFLDLGKTPLANSLISKKNLSKKEKIFPLTVHFCQSCSLVQVTDIVNPEILFSDYYFMTSASSPSIDHFKKYSIKLLKDFIRSSNDLVVDIGGNDGTLLNEIKNDCKVLNIEPANNIAKVSRKKGINTINKFFSKKLVKEIIKKSGYAKVVTANNITAHTDTVRELFEGVRDLLDEDGVFIFETHWVRNLIGEGGFDQVYHEHLSYYSLHALTHLVNLVGLSIFDVETVPIQGESLRVYASKKHKPKPSVKQFLQREKKLGLNDFKSFSKFSKKVLDNKIKTLQILAKIKSQNKKIVGYGAPAKGSTLLNFYGIGKETIDYVIDTTSIKQGLFMPGVHIPIYPPEKLYKSKPDYILLLAWNYADAILKKEKDLIRHGVKFIIPVPNIKIV